MASQVNRDELTIEPELSYVALGGYFFLGAAGAGASSLLPFDRPDPSALPGRALGDVFLDSLGFLSRGSLKQLAVRE
jgi:hypothetical protein